MIKYLLNEIDRLNKELKEYEKEVNRLHDFTIEVSKRRGETEWENNMLTARVHRLENRLKKQIKCNGEK